MTNLIKWPIVRLQELSAVKKNATVGGPFGSNLISADYVSEGVPVVRGVNLNKDAPFNCENLVFVTESKADSLKSNLALPGDLVFTQRGTLGQVGIIPSDTKYKRFLISQSQMKMTVDPLKADSIYLYNYFRLPSTVAYIKNHALQSGVPHINLGILRKIEVICPPFKIQKKIAGIILAYDDLIENNKRRIALLENMAEEIYREWFVRFRFPDYQNTEFKKGIPKDWQLPNLIDAFKFFGGGTPSKKDTIYWDNGIVNWYTPTDITGAKGLFLTSSINKCTEEGVSRSSAKKFPEYSIMLTSRATIGAIGINRTPACTNQGFITCIPNETYPLSFLYHWLKLNKKHFVMLSTGATFLELTKTTFKRIEILTPKRELIAQFDRIVKPMFDQIEQLLVTNEKVQQMKNNLLPRLISGKLSVENLDIQFPPSMMEEEPAS